MVIELGKGVSILGSVTPEPERRVERGRDAVLGIEDLLKTTGDAVYEDLTTLRKTALDRAKIVLEELGVTREQVVESFNALARDSADLTEEKEGPAI